MIDIVEHVGADHRDFIDDKRLQNAHGSGVAREIVLTFDMFEGDIDTEGEEVVDCYTANVDGGDAGGSADGGVLIENVFA